MSLDQLHELELEKDSGTPLLESMSILSHFYC